MTYLIQIRVVIFFLWFHCSLIISSATSIAQSSVPPPPNKNLASLMMTAICTCKWRFQYCVQRSTFVLGLKRKNKFNHQENCNWTYDFLVLAGYLDSMLGHIIREDLYLWMCYQNEFWRKRCSLLFQRIPV